jgi:hypothetical protein
VTEELPVLKETTEPGRTTAVPLPADAIGEAKVRPFSGKAADRAHDSRRQGSRQTMTSGESTGPAASAVPEDNAVSVTKADGKPSFTSAETPPAPPAPASSPSYSGSGRSAPAGYARSEWSTGLDSATTAPAGSATRNDYASGNGYSYGAAATAAAVGGAGAGMASSVGPARQKRGGAPKGFQARKSGKRQAMLTLARVEPWSVMKFSFVASLVAFIILFVAVAVLYMVLSALGVFESLQHTVSTVTSSQSSIGTNIAHWFSASVILGYTALLGALNIVLITAMCTIGSVIYNLIAKTVGGIEVTLRETD